MKVVILAGGKGTRFSEYTKTIPKPMIKVDGKPIIHRIIDHYMKYGHKINLIKTGLNTMTGGRLKRLKKFLKETFLMTYGDGLSNVNINKLTKFHFKKKKLITLTAVRPPARFGAISVEKDIVRYFREKSSLDEGWINGGYFVVEPNFIKFIKNDETLLEQEPFFKVTKSKQMVAFKHFGFWQCMDTLRDKKILDEKLKQITQLV